MSADTVSVSDIRMHYRDDGDGQSVVLIHSLGADGSIFDTITERLCEEFRVVRVDLRGHGGSSLGRRQPGIDVFVDDIRQLMALLGLTGIHLVGQSLGGMIALRLAQSGALARTITVFDTIGWTNKAWDERYRSRAAAVRRQGVASLAAEIARISLGSSSLQKAPGLQLTYASKLAACDNEGYAWSCEAMMGFDYSGALAEITCATTVAVGAEDVVTPPAHAAQVAAAIPGAHYAEVPECGHVPCLEQPEHMVRLITSSNRTPD